MMARDDVKWCELMGAMPCKCQKYPSYIMTKEMMCIVSPILSTSLQNSILQTSLRLKVAAAAKVVADCWAADL